MSKQSITTDKAPNPMPNLFPQATVAGGLVFCSGSIGMTADGTLVEGNIQARTHQIIKNIQAVLEAAGSTLNDIVKINIFLADMGDFAKMNEVYVQYFQAPNLPSRTCVAVKTLPLGTDIEIECTALAVTSPKL